MELDSFLSSPRWDIIKIIIEKPSSPIEIADQLQTTTSFISQQLKLLEAAGLVSKQKTGAFEKGKPRTLFSISKESLYIIPLAKNAPDKKLIPLTKEHKIIINIWSLEDTRLHISLEKFFWQIQENLDDIKQIIVYLKNILPKVYIISENQSLTQKVNKIQKENREVLFQLTKTIPALEEEFSHSIYVSQEAIEESNLKGGKKTNE